MSIRILSDAFIADLKEGLLKPFVDHVRSDSTLMLCIRNGYINIYYRGGNILKIEEKSSGSYGIFFDKDYDKNGLMELPSNILTSSEAVVQWVEKLPSLKQAMDFYFTSNEKLEREFQQIVVRENNVSKISNETEYFITDVEFSIALSNSENKKTARFDLVGVRWDANARQSLKKCKPVLIEMKYADAALGGKAGIESHIKDISALASSDEDVANVLATIEYQYNLLADLGLVNINKKGHIELDKKADLEVMFLLANTNPRGTTLRNLVLASSPEKQAEMPLDKLSVMPNIDLRFFVAHFSGYALHSYCMKTLSEFKGLLKRDD